MGSTDHCDTTEARKLPNINFVGEVPYDEAAAWVHSFDVAMIPVPVDGTDALHQPGESLRIPGCRQAGGRHRPA